MPRKRLSIRPVRKKLSLPSDLVAAVEEQFFSVAKAKPSYGALSSLVTYLLRQWLEGGCPLPEELPKEISSEEADEMEAALSGVPNEVLS